MDTKTPQDGPGAAPDGGDRQGSSSQPLAPAHASGEPVRWAPWWLYLIVLLGANYLRASLMPVGTVPEPVVVVIALAQATVLFLVVTALWRLTHRARR